MFLSDCRRADLNYSSGRGPGVPRRRVALATKYADVRVAMYDTGERADG